MCGRSGVDVLTVVVWPFWLWPFWTVAVLTCYPMNNNSMLYNIYVCVNVLYYMYV